MKHTVHKSESSNDEPGCGASLLALIFLLCLSTIFTMVINDAIESFKQDRYESAEQLQTILKEELKDIKQSIQNQ